MGDFNPCCFGALKVGPFILWTTLPFFATFYKNYSRKHVIVKRGEAVLAMHSRKNLENRNLEG